MKLFEAAKSVAITEVLENMCGVTLPQRRRNVLTSCPLCGCGTNTPCFGLYGSSKGILDKFKCFSCGQQGDSIKLVKEYTGLSTDADAAREICTYFNIEYDDTASAPSQEYLDYVKTYNYCAKLFASCYKSDFNSNKDYFETRGLSAKTIKDYSLGYCPSVFISKDGRHLSLKDILLKLSLPLVDGLFNSSGECVFADRYIFPIRNTKGDVIAFSGRSLDPNLPKYINTCETNFFKKSFALFNFNKAKSYPTVYVVEGYMDALSLVESGIPNVVAAMGTAFSSSHLSVLKNKNIILSLDHDGAGLTHTLNIIEQFKNIYFRVMYTPKEYKDFNEMLMAKQDIKSYLTNTELKTGPEFLIRFLTHTSDMSMLEVRSKIWERIATLIGTYDPAYIRSYPINTLYTPIEISYYWKMYQKFIKKNRKEVK